MGENADAENRCMGVRQKEGESSWAREENKRGARTHRFEIESAAVLEFFVTTTTNATDVTNLCGSRQLTIQFQVW